jgi:hypothetical protein
LVESWKRGLRNVNILWNILTTGITKRKARLLIYFNGILFKGRFG